MAILPDGIALMGGRFSSPRRMIAPLPKSFSIWAIARSRALDRSFCAAVVAFFFGAMTLSSFSRLYFRSGLYKLSRQRGVNSPRIRVAGTKASAVRLGASSITRSGHRSRPPELAVDSDRGYPQEHEVLAR